MFQTFKNAWKIDELRKKIIYTLFILLVFRLGSALVVPFVNASILEASLLGDSSTIFGFFDMMSGGAFSQATIFALGVTPYINASIIINLLDVVVPSLAELARQGEEGRKKLTKITRYFAVALSFALAVIYYFLVRHNGALVYDAGGAGFFSALVIILSFTAGAMLLMWLGEQIDTNGIGSGVSLIIFTGIIASLINVFPQIISYLNIAAGNVLGYEARPSYYALIPIIILLFAATFVLIIVMNAAERRIPIQYAKRVVGRKMYGGQNSNIPIRVNMTGVIPVIFASAILTVPATIKDFFNIGGGWGTFLGWFSTDNWGYALLYALLILGFNYFYVAIQYNPIEMANNLRKNSGSIPGIRPGRPTSDFIRKVISKITLIGGGFLVIVAILPIIITMTTDINISLGGTSVLIIVGVALEVSETLESYMLMRHHKGFLE